MRLQTRHSPLFLLLLPSLTSAFADSSIDPENIIAAKDVVEPTNFKSSRGVPTKFAPVDGKDGKPHTGPFVETDVSTGGDLSDLPPLKGRPDDWASVDGKKIPKTNDGVMFDKNRERPQEGTTGMEGGVSEKSKAKDAQEAKAGGKVLTQPESPKEQPPLPHSEDENVNVKSKDKDTKKAKSSDDIDDASYTGLDKPDNLPEKPKQKPPPLPDSANKDHLDLSPSKSGSKKAATKIIEDDDEEGIIQPFHSFVLSLAMILVSEVGDKTFLVAALMAMKHDRIVVFTAAFGALLVMTVLSAILGHTVPVLVPKSITSFAASGLFFIFGAKLLNEGMKMDPNEGVGAEMSEVEQELAEKEREMGRQRGGSVDPHALEMGIPARRSRSKSRFPSPARSPSTSPTRLRPGAWNSFAQGTSNLASLILSPAWVQTFVMTFLGEWGDRSQIATIAMAAGQDYWWVTLGAMVGHAICTGAAVIGGRAIAGRVSLKVVTVGGAVAFLIFGFIYLIEAFYA